MIILILQEVEAQKVSATPLKTLQPVNSGARAQTQDSLTSETNYLTTRKAYMCYLYFDLPK